MIKEGNRFRLNEKSSIGHTTSECFVQCKKVFWGLLKDYIEERAIQIVHYIIENNATVRQTEKEFGISKSTVHMDDTDRSFLEDLRPWSPNIPANCQKPDKNKVK